jgi:hypothetical protein
MDKPIESKKTPEELTLAGPPVPRSPLDVVAFVRGNFAREPGLFTVGLAGMVIALLSLIAVTVRGSFIPPEGKMLDAATFTFGVGLFTLTIALLLPLAGYSQSARRRWRRAFYVFVVYGLVLEPLQAFRGLDPRFTEVGEPVDIVAGIVFGVTAALNTILFLILGIRFFRANVLHDRARVRLGIRYGVAAVMLSFGVGIAMSLMAGRETGDGGNLLVVHALGVHGIQFVPLVAFLLAWADTAPRATTCLHAAGIGWLLACTAALAQAVVGRSPLEMSIFTGLMVAGLAAWAAALGYSLLSWRRVAPGLAPPA